MASQRLLRRADRIASASLASPTTIVAFDTTADGTSFSSLDFERTRTVTWWPCAWRAGKRREPTLPVAPSSRTRMANEFFHDVEIRLRSSLLLC